MTRVFLVILAGMLLAGAVSASFYSLHREAFDLFNLAMLSVVLALVD